MAGDETSKPTPAAEAEPVVAISEQQKKSSGDDDDTTRAKDNAVEKEEGGSDSKPEEEESAAKENKTTEGDESADESSTATPNVGGASPKDESGGSLREYEKKALTKLKVLLEDAILGDKLFNDAKDIINKSKEPEKPKSAAEKDGPEEEPNSSEVKEGNTDNETKETAADATTTKDGEKLDKEGEEKEKFDDADNNNNNDNNNDKAEETNEKAIEEEEKVQVDKNVSLWGVPLLPSKGDKGTDVVLLKFLRAKEFRVTEAFEMLRITLQWRKEMKIDSVLEEDFGPDLNSAAYISGVDREGHPVCYNVYGVFSNDEIYNKTLGTEEGQDKYLRWRSQLMEKGIQKLDFQPGGVSSLVQISDLKNTPGPARKELRLATKQDVGILQDNYPELVARNIFINVPFWYYAFNALIPPLLVQKNKTRFVFARPAKVAETLLKYLTVEEIPVQYGGLKRENDNEFSVNDEAQELSLKGSSTETIEIPAPEPESTLVWDVTVLGWDVNYKEEFVPEDPKSYTIIVQKERRIVWQEDSVRNTFTNRERGKVVLTIENGSFKKKRVLYRYKAKDSSASSSTN